MKWKLKDLLAHIEKLKIDPETEILLCIDGMKSNEQWEDYLGGVAYSSRTKQLIFVNESFE